MNEIVPQGPKLQCYLASLFLLLVELILCTLLLAFYHNRQFALLTVLKSQSVCHNFLLSPGYGVYRLYRCEMEVKHYQRAE